MTFDDTYVRKWFISFDALVRRSGGTERDIRSLLNAGAAPGVIYATGAGDLWCALAAPSGATAPADATHWYAPAALYWLRHGILALRSGSIPAEAAERNQDRFARQFAAALVAEPLASAAFPNAFAAGKVHPDQVMATAAREWASWRDGGYAVCLRSFTGASCVQKEAIGYALRRQRSGDGDAAIPDDALLDLIERLDALLLPFAPSQRPGCTPGVTIDRLLDVLRLGATEPYAAETCAESLPR